MSKYEFSTIFPNNSIYDQLFQVRFNFVVKALSYLDALSEGKYKGKDMKSQLKKVLRNKVGLETNLDHIFRSIDETTQDVNNKLKEIVLEMLTLLDQDKYVDTLRDQFPNSHIFGFI